MPTLSFVMTYNDRPEQLRNTLTILKSSVLPGDQIVIVDDASQPNLSARSVLAGFDLPILLSEIRPERKWWINPSIPYNMGFQMASCDAVVIMNSECIPIGGAIEFLRMQVRSDNYVVLPCYSTTEVQFRDICRKPYQADQIVRPHRTDLDQANQWYHHPIHHPTWYHFMTCLTLGSLRQKVHGFDERFSRGYCFDDNSFLHRIRTMGLKIESWDENYGYVIHQWHPKNSRFRGGCPEWQRNLQLWDRIRGGQEEVWTSDESVL